MIKDNEVRLIELFVESIQLDLNCTIFGDAYSYMYAVTIGFIELIQAIVIVITFNTHNLGSATDYLAILKGSLLLVLALVAFKKQQTPVT